ncbi:CBO0543 family protein [Metabacillus schmidteae]|uniref:CBO0543 family protein n=1 Tax=Metabacillus schmidteae TaxID=2730405 RepID=UPI001F237032|nr:CBO0543 family protein [Metabacillus schmidteae]
MKVNLPQEQLDQLHELKSTQEKVSNDWIDYWFEYSSFDTWQFWVNVSFIIIPLIVLYIFIDKKRVFLLGFYGFNIHVWMVYTDAIGTRYNFFEYPYKAVPFLPIHVGIDTSLVPVLFILLYQWILHKKKNFYLYNLGLILFLSFIFKPIIVSHHLFHLKNGANFLYIFLLYVIVVLISRAITNVFIYLHSKSELKETH